MTAHQKPLKILYTAFDVVPAPKGASVRIQHMLRHLAGLKNTQVKAIVLGEPGFPATEVTPEGVIIERLIVPSGSFLERSVAFAEAVIATCMTFQPDVVQYRSLWDAFPLLRWRDQQQRAFKAVYELHGLPEYELEHHFENLSEDLLQKVRAQQAEVLNKSDIILCPSAVHLRNLRARGIAKEKCLQVPNGVDTEHFTPPQTQPSPAEITRLVYVGTLAPWQGLEHLLEALALLPTPFQLQLVGKGQRRWVRDLLTRAFQLHLSHTLDMVGPVPYAMVPAFIQGADIALAPLDTSKRNCVQGCMPLKILEYMACGRAIVASDIAVNRALLTHEHNALLYPAENAEALAKTLERLVQDPELRTRLGTQANQDAQRHYAWGAGFQAISDMYSDPNSDLYMGSVPPQA